MENDTDQFVHDHFVPLFILGVWGLVVNLSTVTQITVLMCDSYHFIFSIPLMDSFCSLISFLIFDIGLLLLLWGQDKLICRILDTSVLSPILLGSLYLAQISYMRFVDQRKFSLTEVLSATFFGLSYIFTLNIISYCQDVHLTKIGEVSFCIFYS